MRLKSWEKRFCRNKRQISFTKYVEVLNIYIFIEFSIQILSWGKYLRNDSTEIAKSIKTENSTQNQKRGRKPGEQGIFVVI